jgi:sugar transferase EpsL
MTYRRSLKRAIDVVIGGLALCASAPVLAVVAVIVRVRLGSPVLFRQRRPGRQERPFEILKFRTMREGVDSKGMLLPDSLRLDRFGRFLRSTSLDELPELWNVVKGEMSLVGPRPLLMRYLDRYTEGQRHRHDVRPGITGLAQVSGRNALDWEQKFELDLEYVRRCSFILDLQILARTVSSLARREGIAREGHATAPEFMGPVR